MAIPEDEIYKIAPGLWHVSMPFGVTDYAVSQVEAMKRHAKLTEAYESGLRERKRMKDRLMELRDFLRKGVDGDPDVGLAAANDAMMEAADAVDALIEAREHLNLIDATDPEEHVYSCSADAVRGFVIQMGQRARLALARIDAHIAQEEDHD